MRSEYVMSLTGEIPFRIEMLEKDALVVSSYTAWRRYAARDFAFGDCYPRAETALVPCAKALLPIQCDFTIAAMLNF